MQAVPFPPVSHFSPAASSCLQDWRSSSPSSPVPPPMKINPEPVSYSQGEIFPACPPEEPPSPDSPSSSPFAPGPELMMMVCIHTPVPESRIWPTKTLQMKFCRTAASGHCSFSRLSFLLLHIFHTGCCKAASYGICRCWAEGMLRRSVPLPTTRVTQEDMEGPYRQMWTASNPSVKAATSYHLCPALSTVFSPCLVVCSRIRKLFAVFLLKERWFSRLSEGTERLCSLWSFQSCS